jgi:hypothetical protein
MGEDLSEPPMPLDSFEPVPPRRDALRALLASGVAVVGLSRFAESASAKIKKQKKKKKKKGGGASIVFGSSLPYDVAAGASTQVSSACPSNTIPISYDPDQCFRVGQ